MYGYSKKRPTKEPDIFQKTLGEPVRRISGLGLALAAGLLGLLVLMVVLWVVAGRGEEREGKGWKAFSEALGENDLAKRVRRLEQLADEFSGTSVRPVALLEAAVLLHDDASDLPADKKLQRDEGLRKSAALTTKFLSEHPGHPLAAVARMRLALVQEDSGETAKALRTFEAAHEQAVGSDFAYLAGELLYGQARCKAKLGDKVEAVRLLERALSRREDRSRYAWYPAAEGLRQSLRPPAKKDLRVPGAVPDQVPEPEKPAAPEDSKKDVSPKAGDGKPAGVGAKPAAPAGK